jgi:hypothetical protein
MTAKHSANAGCPRAFEQLMTAYYEECGVASIRKAGDKHRFIVDGIMVVAAFVEHAHGPGIFLVAHFDVDMSRGHAELLANAMCNNFFMHALGVPTTWGINPITDQFVAMLRLPLPELTPAALGAHLQHFIAAAKKQFREMTTAGMLAHSNADGLAGSSMRSRLFAKAAAPAAPLP